MTPARRRHLFLLGGTAESLVAFRGPFIREMLARDWRVTASADGDDKAAERALKVMGADYTPAKLDRVGIDPLGDAATILRLTGLLRRLRPDAFLGYTLKPALYGVMAAKLAGVASRTAMIEGLGYAFGDGEETRRRLARLAAKALMRAVLPLATRIVVLNPDDERFVRQSRFVSASARLDRLAGIGVDLDRFAFTALPEAQPLTFIMISRLLRDKGVYDYVAAARAVRRVRPEARFILVGNLDSNPSSVQTFEVEAWIKEGLIDYRGEQPDVAPHIRESHVLVLPSHDEGFPVTPMEAMATGRPVIVTDVRGCREVVTHGEDGWLTPPKDAVALAATMILAMTAPLATLGRAARRRAEIEFSDQTQACRLADWVEETVPPPYPFAAANTD